MASKRKHKDTDPGEVAGSIAPGDDAPPVDVQDATGGDTPGAVTGDDAPEPITTVDADDAPPAPAEDMPPVETPTTDPGESAPVGDPSGTLSTLEADAPPADADKGGKGKGKPGRYATRAAKDERNRKEKERREAKARERAGQVARATGVADKAARAKAAKDAAPASSASVDADVAGLDLSVLLGLSFHALSKAVPERFGGGDLTAEERDLLGRAWAPALAPYLKGAGGPWAMAAIATVQVFAVRAMTYTPPKPPAPVHSRPVDTTPAPVAPVAAPIPAPVKGATQQEPGVGED